MAIDEARRVTIEEGVVFGTGGGRELKCDVYTPPGRPANAPAVLLVHGGGWNSGDRTQLRGYGILLGREGYVCVCTEYRLSGEATWPAQIHDVKAALRWMRANSERLGIDSSKIAIEGNSAGAHLALIAAGTPGVAEFEGEGGNEGVSSHVAAAIAIYAPSDFTRGGAEAIAALKKADSGAVGALMGPDVTLEQLRGASPVTYANASFPPTMLIHGTADTTVPHESSLWMNQALGDANVPVELHVFAGQPHAFDQQPAFGRQCAALMLLFLSRYVASPAE